jgi:hypothetical protein
MSRESSRVRSIPVWVNNDLAIWLVLESKIDCSIREYGGQSTPTETRCRATIERSRHESIAWVNASLVNTPMTVFIVLTSRQCIRALPNVCSRGLAPTRSRQRRRSEFRRIVIEETKILRASRICYARYIPARRPIVIFWITPRGSPKCDLRRE